MFPSVKNFLQPMATSPQWSLSFWLARCHCNKVSGITLAAKHFLPSKEYMNTPEVL
jgi:hypothetical protein